MKTRSERDSFGIIEVPADCLWGAQTERARQLFDISSERLPDEFLLALVECKRAGAEANAELGRLPGVLAKAIVGAADEILAGRWRDQFPLAVWQTGSGTQTHMNVNEVLANRASELLGGERGEARLVHANDQVNLGQSTNDLFPTAMHVAACVGLTTRLLPALRNLSTTLAEKSAAFADIIKTGRTHLQDAVPLTLGQEFSAYVAQLRHAEAAIAATLPALYELAVGATAVGTGLNTHPQFGSRVAGKLAQRLGIPFVVAANKFAAIAAHDALVATHGALKTLAAALAKIANDIRWLASGPRCGLGELSLPDNEPGSSIMPGKINPTQCEALLMVCYQVFGNDVAINFGGASGNFELNACKPLIVHNFLQSVRLLGDAMASFDRHCARGIEANRAQIAAALEHSLMLVTALTPHIGYDRAAKIARHAHATGGSLQAAAAELGEVSAEDFARWVDPARMLQPETEAEVITSETQSGK